MGQPSSKGDSWRPKELTGGARIRLSARDSVPRASHSVMHDSIESLLSSLPPPSTSPLQAVKSRNQMRDSVKSLFPERDCFALVRPCLEEEQLANMDGLTMQQLRPEFRKVRAALTRGGGGMPSHPLPKGWKRDALETLPAMCMLPFPSTPSGSASPAVPVPSDAPPAFPPPPSPSLAPSLQGFERLTDLVLAKAQPKQYRGQFLSGSAIATFAQVGGRGGRGGSTGDSSCQAAPWPPRPGKLGGREREGWV